MALAASFTDIDVLLIDIAHLADGRLFFSSTMRTSPEGRRTCAYLPSLAIS